MQWLHTRIAKLEREQRRERRRERRERRERRRLRRARRERLYAEYDAYVEMAYSDGLCCAGGVWGDITVLLRTTHLFIQELTS